MYASSVRHNTHLASLSFALPNPYAKAGEGCNKTEENPAIAADVVATLSINPRRLVVLISSPFDIESAEDLTDTWLIDDGTNAYDGDRRAMAVHAIDRRELATMVSFLLLLMVLLVADYDV